MSLRDDCTTGERRPVLEGGWRPVVVRRFAVLVAAIGLVLGWLCSPTAAGSLPPIAFDMVPSAGALACLPDARGHVKVTSLGPVERMDVHVSGLPAEYGV